MIQAYCARGVGLHTLAPPLLCLLSFAIGVNGQTPTHNDVAYAQVTNDDGSQATLRMDVWEAKAGIERPPLAIWIHGGAWLAGSYNDQPPGLQSLLDAGYAVASVQYRLSGAAIFPAQIHDVKGATRFLRAHAEEYRLDPSRFAAFGGSAGGHLAALLATSGGVDALEGTTGGNSEFSSRVQAAIDYFGPTDFWSVESDITTPPGCVINHDANDSPESKLIGFDAQGQGIAVLRENLENSTAPYPEKAQLVKLANPISHADSSDPPIFIVHGDKDNVVPMKQSARLADALRAAGVTHEYRIVEGGGHGFGAQEPAVNDQALAFLNAKLRPTADDGNR
jgi:acetyl esterase/lipase